LARALSGSEFHFHGNVSQSAIYIYVHTNRGESLSDLCTCHRFFTTSSLTKCF